MTNVKAQMANQIQSHKRLILLNFEIYLTFGF
jgi:hypothetical protein